MYLKFCRTPEKLTKAACPVETQGRQTSVHVSIHLFTDEHELVEWKPPLPNVVFEYAINPVPSVMFAQ